MLTDSDGNPVEDEGNLLFSPENLRRSKRCFARHNVYGFWADQTPSFSEAQVGAFCAAYKEHILGTLDPRQIEMVHSGIIPPRKDWEAFYQALVRMQVITPTRQELTDLVDLSRSFQFEKMLAALDDAVPNPYTGTLLDSMARHEDFTLVEEYV